MRKIALISAAILLFCGCSCSRGGSTYGSSFLKTSDGGEKWEAKVQASEGQNISEASILSLVSDPGNSSVLYAGTLQDGLFKTENGGEKWSGLEFPPTKIYSLALDKNNNARVFASGVWQGIGKIYRSEDGGENWKEIYTEPSSGTVITALAINPNDSSVLYAGNSEGALFKSDNAGETWYNLHKAPDAVTQIVFDALDSRTAYFLVEGKTLLVTRDGKEFKDLEKNIKGEKIIGGIDGLSILSAAVDPSKNGTVYAGHDKGILRSADFGESWSDLDVLESSKSYPVRALAVNPANSSEIIYCAAQAVYKTTDGGLKWSTYELATSRRASAIIYNRQNPAEIYLAFRKE